MKGRLTVLLMEILLKVLFLLFKVKGTPLTTSDYDTSF